MGERKRGRVPRARKESKYQQIRWWEPGFRAACLARAGLMAAEDGVGDDGRSPVCNAERKARRSQSTDQGILLWSGDSRLSQTGIYSDVKPAAHCSPGLESHLDQCRKSESLMQPVISLMPHLVSITRSYKLATRDLTLFLEFSRSVFIPALYARVCGLMLHHTVLTSSRTPSCTLVQQYSKQ